MSYDQAAQIKQIVEQSDKIVIVQADNPDADSIGSALALEEILGDMGKSPYLYCGVDIPSYLRYMSGWDRIQKDLPNQFDVSIIVDASTVTLLERLSTSGQMRWLANKPCIVLDHHETVDNLIPFSAVVINDFERSSAGEVIYALAKQLGWDVSVEAQYHLMTSILGDTQGLSNNLASPDTYRIMAEMIETGVDRPSLEERRREFGKMDQEIFRYKAELINRTEFNGNGDVALVTVPQADINRYSPLYNPAPLVQTDMLQTKGVRVAIVLKSYDDGKITAAIRCNSGSGIAADLAVKFGGGGHAFASGFKVTDGRSLDQIKQQCLEAAEALLTEVESA